MCISVYFPLAKGPCPLALVTVRHEAFEATADPGIAGKHPCWGGSLAMQ